MYATDQAIWFSVNSNKPLGKLLRAQLAKNTTELDTVQIAEWGIKHFGRGKSYLLFLAKEEPIVLLKACLKACLN